MIPIAAASIPTYARILLKTAPPDRSRFLPTFAQTGLSTQNATIELVVWVCGFLIVVVIASPFVHKYIKKLRECEEPVDKDAMLADFRAAYRSGQMDEAEFRRISELINNPVPANPASLKAGSLRPSVERREHDPNPLDPASPAIEPRPDSTTHANDSKTLKHDETTPVDAQPTAPIDSARPARDDTALIDPSSTSAAGDSLVDSQATHES
jgi:hypothetical protein